MSSNISAALKEIRERSGLGLSEFANKVGYDVDDYACIEDGDTETSIDLAEKIRIVGGIDPFVLHWVRSGDTSQLPKRVQFSASRLQEIWTGDVEAWEAACAARSAK